MSELSFTSFGTKTDFFGDFFGPFQVRKLSAHEIKLVNEDGDTATLTGSFLIKSFNGAAVVDVSSITFADRHRHVTARLDDISNFDGTNSIRQALNLLTKEADSTVGTIGSDIMSVWGATEKSSIYGLAGNDTIMARKLGEDMLFDGGLGKDVLDFSKLRLDGDSSSLSGIDADMEGFVSSRIGMNAEFTHFEKIVGTRYGDIFSCGEADPIFFTTGAGDDLIYGGDGTSRFKAGTGTDEIIGGSGAQTLVFGRHSETDTFLNFEVGTDKIEIQKNLGFKSFSDLEDFIVMDNDDFARIDFGAGDVLEIELSEAGSLSEDDFVF